MSLRSECVLVGMQPDVECSFVRLGASAGLERRINKRMMWQEFALDVYPLPPEFERPWDVLPMDPTENRFEEATKFFGKGVVGPSPNGFHILRILRRRRRLVFTRLAALRRRGLF